MIKTEWSSQREGFTNSLTYMKGRKEGLIKSIKTPWEKFNDAATDGIEWNSVTVIGGRPGAFKTGLKDQIVRESFLLNPGQDFRVLEFSFEMLARVSAIREYSSVLGRSYKYLCSAEDTLSEEDLQRCYEYAKERVKYPVDVVEQSCTVDEFKEIIIKYMRHHKTENFKKTIITVDHTLLFRLGDGDKNKNDMLFHLGEVLTELKRKYPIAFIILSQLNRNVDTPERSEDGKYGNYILESDIFGADAMLQHADVLIGLNRPGKQKIKFYGPDRFIIEDDRVLVMHFIKCRNGDTRLSFFKAEFEKMQLVEMYTPPCQEKRSKK